MKKKSVFRSMFTLALSLVMMLSLAASASAASITIKNSDGQPSIGDATRFVAYQIFKGSLSTEHSGGGNELVGITWGDGVNSTNLVTALKSSDLPVEDGSADTFGTKFTNAWNEWNGKHEDSISEAELVAQFLNKHFADSEYADDFARIVAGCTFGEGKQSEYIMDGSDWVINLTENGYYLVKDTYKSEKGNKEPDGAVSSYILQVSGDASVTIKSTIPTVEKKVQGADGYLAEIGQDVTFTLTGKVAQNIGEYDTYSYTFTDTLSKGLSFDLETAGLTVEIVNGESRKTINKDGNYEATYVAQGSDGKHVLTVTFINLKAAAANADATLNGSSEVVVTYKAKLNKDAVVGTAGNENNVTLTYSNNPYVVETGESVPDEVRTYTLGLDVVKQNDSSEKLENVKFKLKKNDVADQYAKLEVKKDADDAIEYYTITEWVSDASTTDTELVTNKNGEFHIHGLSAGTYTLVETEPLKDYEKMNDITFIISGGTDATEATMGEVSLALDPDHPHRTDVAITKDMATGDGTATLTLTNYKAPILPNTGGIGAKIVYVVSGLAVLIGLCIVAAALKKRKGDKA